MSGLTRGESAGGEACPMRGRAASGDERLLAARPVPCEGGSAWGEGSLRAVGPVHAGEGGERGVCWR